jgi:hypothetical protein
MPKSKRDHKSNLVENEFFFFEIFLFKFFFIKVSLTKTKKKGVEFKQNLINEIRGCLDEYENVFIISIFNQRNNYLKELRQNWSHSRFVFLLIFKMSLF